MNAHTLPASDYVQKISPEMVRVERLLPANVDRVWEYITRSDKRSQWLAAGEMELKLGGRVEHVFRNSQLTTNDDPAPEKYKSLTGEFRMIGEITEYEPMRLLAYSWDDDLEVRYELTPVGEQTRLVVTHSRLRSRGGLIGFSAGWHTHLDILADRLAGKEPKGFWRTHTQLESEYEARF